MYVTVFTGHSHLSLVKVSRRVRRRNVLSLVLDVKGPGERGRPRPKVYFPSRWNLSVPFNSLLSRAAFYTPSSPSLSPVRVKGPPGRSNDVRRPEPHRRDWPRGSAGHQDIRWRRDILVGKKEPFVSHRDKGLTVKPTPLWRPFFFQILRI